MCNHTRVIPFQLVFQPGESLYEQVVFAAKRAIVSGQLRAGDAFPSVRTLSRELKINPNTAHKVVMQLTQEGLLDVRPGQGTFVAAPAKATRADKTKLLQGDVERLLVEAHHLGLDMDDILEAVRQQWDRLNGGSRK